MKTLFKFVIAIGVALAIAGCAGTPVKLGTQSSTPVPKGTAREISSEACGTQLLLFIPIMINGRLDRAYRELEAQAGGDYITDVQMQERWTYIFVGTNYCTALHAKAIHAGT